MKICISTLDFFFNITLQKENAPEVMVLCLGKFVSQ